MSGATVPDVDDPHLHRGHEFRNLVLLTGTNATAGGHLIEHAWSKTSTGHRYEGLQLRLKPWRRRHGEYQTGPGLVLGFHPRVGRWLDARRWRMAWRGLRWRVGLRYGLVDGGAVATSHPGARECASEPVAHPPR